MQVTGKVLEIKETQVVSDKFTKRELWVEIPSDKFPQTLSIEFRQARVALLDNISINEEVTIEINLRGRQWKEKVFNTIEGWKITANNSVQKHAQTPKALPIKTEQVVSDVDFDLPF